jgi:hypothetical protein
MRAPSPAIRGIALVRVRARRTGSGCRRVVPVTVADPLVVLSSRVTSSGDYGLGR